MCPANGSSVCGAAGTTHVSAVAFTKVAATVNGISTQSVTAALVSNRELQPKRHSGRCAA